MEHESFEDPETARRLNETFICIKVDREERPDPDQVYMEVCQLMTGSGGWPLTVLLTPDRIPFFAGTCLPRTRRGARIGIHELCEQVGTLWATDCQQLTSRSGQLMAVLQAEPAGKRDAKPAGRDLVERGVDQLAARFDRVNGGFGTAPKFPTPHNLLLLLGMESRSGDGTRLAMVRSTLLAMVRGGIHDQLGGGFHRYATDSGWRVPHFEKMLYDQAGILMALTQCLEADARVLRDLRLPGEGAGRLEWLLGGCPGQGSGFGCYR